MPQAVWEPRWTLVPRTALLRPELAAASNQHNTPGDRRITSIKQTQKLRLREDKFLAQGHTVGRWA